MYIERKGVGLDIKVNAKELANSLQEAEGRVKKVLRSMLLL